jgi:hypothetical protein
MLGYLIYLKYLVRDTISDFEKDYTGYDADVPDYVVPGTTGGDDQIYYYMRYYDHLYRDIYSSFERYYAWIAVFDMPSALNSTINPLIYYWRMKPFRLFVHNQCQEGTFSHSDINNRKDLTTNNNLSTRERISKIWKEVERVASPAKRPSRSNRPLRRITHFENKCRDLNKSVDIVGTKSV